MLSGPSVLVAAEVLGLAAEGCSLLGEQGAAEVWEVLAQSSLSTLALTKIEAPYPSAKCCKCLVSLHV